MNYRELSEFLAAGRNPTSHRTIANNTWVEPRDDNQIAIRLHKTDILIFSPNGSVRLETGDWFTVTTKQRINRFMPNWFSLWQENYEWYVNNWTQNETVPFFNGMTFDYESGELLNPENIAAAEDTKTDNEKTSKRINEYVSRYTDSKISELVETAKANGTRGDCLYCQLKISDSPEHLETHIGENYLMVSTLVNALKDKGYPDPGFILQIGTMGDSIRSALKAYLRKNLTTLARS